MGNTKSFANRSLAVVSAIALGVASVLPLVSGSADAGQLQERAIKLSKSATGSTNTAMELSFKASATTAVQGIVVQFCANSPILSVGTCTNTGALTSFNTNDTTTTVASTNLPGGTYAVDAAESDAQTLVITNASATALTAGNTYTIQLGDDSTNGLTLGTSTGSYYARVAIYSSTTGANNYTTGTPGTTIDQGGVALSNTAAIALSATVQETLAFAVTTTSIVLGHGSPAVIDNTATDTATTGFTINTNANGGAVIRLKGDTLRSGTNSLATQNALAAMTAGSATNQFGIRTANGTATTGSIVADAQYAHGSNYAFETAATNGTYGDAVFNTNSAAVDTGAGTITYGATAALTTPAGIYTATHQLIATGTF